MGQILLLSNGHGEDVSGALIGQALMEWATGCQALPWWALEALTSRPASRCWAEAMNSAPAGWDTPVSTAA